MQTDSFAKTWTVVFAAFTGQMFGVGTLIIYSFGLFTEPLAEEFGWSYVDIALALTVFNYSVVLGAFVVGRLIDRIGARSVILPSTVLFACVLGSLYFLTASLLHLYLIFFLAAVLGCGTLPIGHARIIVDWFDKRRGLALGLVLSGVGIGAAVLPPLIQYLLDTMGWRIAYLVLGALVLFVSFPIGALFLREADNTRTVCGANPAQDSHGATPLDTLRHLPIWILGLFSFTAGLVLIGALAHFVPMLRHAGVSGQQAAGYASIIGMSVVLGRVSIGWLVDRFFAPRVIFVFFLAPCIAFILLQSPDSQLPYALSAIGIGLALGAEVDVLAYLVSRYFGTQHFGVLYGGLFSVFTIGAANGPLLIAYLYETQSGYDLALLILTLATLLICGLTFLMPKFPSKA